MKWTREQEQVINLRNRNILVSAAAGSGKTAVLVERIIQMVTDEEHPIDIDRLLIVTFTNAAAAQMRERIEAAIEKKLLEEPENEHLQKQLTLIHSAQITTTHSFCLNVIRNNFNLIDLDPTFRIGDDAELKLMQSDLIADILEEEYTTATPAFLKLVESYSNSKSDAPIEDLILQLHRFSMSYPWPEEWLQKQSEAFDIANVEEMRKMEFMKVLFDYVSAIVRDLQGEMDRAIELAESSDGPYTYIDNLHDDKQQLQQLLGLSTFEEYYLALHSIEFGALSRKKMEGVNEGKKKQVQDIRKYIKKVKDDLIEKYFYQSEELMLEDIIDTKDVMQELVRLTLRFHEEYAKTKEEKVVVDFNDLEHFALKILVNHTEAGEEPTSVAKELAQFYEEILVDEYQDSNYVQETILNSISKERLGRPNVFMVGDVKQSIYKFRLARPELFMEKYEKYTHEESLYQKIDLHKNFRSRNTVLDAINFIFEQIMTKKLGNIEYDQDAALYAGARFPECEEKISDDSELMIVTLSNQNEEEPEDATSFETLDGTDGEEDEEEYTKRELEAKAVAMRIKELVSGKEPFKVVGKDGLYRNATYSDIVILLRTMSNWSEVFVDILLSAGIPAYADTTSGYFKTLEIKTILNMLRIIDNPLQDIPFTAILHSPIAKVTNEELAHLRTYDKDALMYHIVTDYSLHGEDMALRDKLSKFLELLNKYREMEHYFSIHELIIKVLEETHYYDYVSAMPAGQVRRGNIDMLIQKAITFESSSYTGLFQFIRYIEKLHKYDVDFGEASVSNENDNTVRIMSIHKSKGLEFPIVFVSGLGKNFNTQDSKSKIVIHPDMGLGPDVIDLNLRVKAPTLVKKVIQKMQVLENLGEELRVLYVALTRAKEKLIMTGFVKDFEKTFDKYQSLHEQKKSQLEFLQLSSATTFMDYIIPPLMRHKKVFQQMVKFLNPNNSFLVSDEEVPMDLKIITSGMLIGNETKKRLEDERSQDVLLHWDAEKIYNQEIHDQIRNLLRFEYPFQTEVELTAKVTVTELKRLSQLEEDADSQNLTSRLSKEEMIPNFMRTTDIITGANKGTLYHKILEEIQLFQSTSSAKIREEINRLIAEEKIPVNALEKVNIKHLEQFSNSNLAKRMYAAQLAKKLYREQQFVIGIKANEINQTYSSDEIMLVQGIIDVYFEEEDGLVLLDYKTDIVKSKSESELVEKYKVQLDYYQRALEQMTGKTVKEKIIYSFYLGKEIIL